MAETKFGRLSTKLGHQGSDHGVNYMAVRQFSITNDRGSRPYLITSSKFCLRYDYNNIIDIEHKFHVFKMDF